MKNRIIGVLMSLCLFGVANFLVSAKGRGTAAQQPEMNINLTDDGMRDLERGMRNFVVITKAIENVPEYKNEETNKSLICQLIENTMLNGKLQKMLSLPEVYGLEEVPVKEEGAAPSAKVFKAKNPEKENELIRKLEESVLNVSKTPITKEDVEESKKGVVKRYEDLIKKFKEEAEKEGKQADTRFFESMKETVQNIKLENVIDAKKEIVPVAKQPKEDNVNTVKN